MPALISAGCIAGLGVLSALGVVSVWIAILGTFAIAAIGLSASIPERPILLRRLGDMLVCERGDVRLFAAPLGDVLEVRLQTVQGKSKMVIHRLGKRWYDVPGVHDTALLEQVRDRLCAEAPAIGQTEDAPADLEGLRGRRTRDEP